MNVFAQAMSMARVNSGLSQVKLSKKSGVPIKTLEGYESGKHEPKAYNLVLLANALEISIDEYIGRVFE